MKFGKYIGNTAGAIALVLLGGSSRDPAVNPYGPCVPKPVNVQTIEVSYKQGGCIPEPFPRPRPRPGTPDEVFNRNYSTAEMDSEGIEINKPENKGEGLACVPGWVHPFMPHIIPGGHGSSGSEMVYRKSQDGEEIVVYKNSRTESTGKEQEIALDQCDGDYIRIKLGPIEIEKCTPKEKPEKTSYNPKDLEGLLLADYPNDRYGPVDPNPFTQIKQPGV